MKIAIVGSGNIGAGLGKPWAARGHQVTFASRNPEAEKLRALCQSIGATARGLAEATRDAQVVVLAMPFGELPRVLEAVGDLAGKVVVDCTNAVDWKQGHLQFPQTTSAAEALALKLPQARVFKSFNAQGAENLANPSYQGTPATNFFCGDDAEGREMVAQLVRDVGFEAVCAGPLSAARFLEPLMMLWVSTSAALGTRELAFKLLRR